jgi:hypothetical protein
MQYHFMFVFKKYDRQNHVWSFMTKYLRFLCKFTSWSVETPTGNFSDVLNSFPHGRFWQLVFKNKEQFRCTRLMRRSLHNNNTTWFGCMLECVSEWVSECLTAIQQLFSYIMARTSSFSMRWRWFPLCSRPIRELDFYSASSLKQQFAGRYVASLGHIILIPGQPVFALSP